MKKILSAFFIFFIVTLNLFLPISVFADDPTMEIILKTETEHGTTGKWAWGFEINTTNIPNGTTTNISIYENDTNLYGPIQNEQINNNSLMYLTGFILNPDTNYSIVVQTVNPVMIKSYSKKTPTGTVAYDPIIEGNPSSTIGNLKPPPPSQTQVQNLEPKKNSGDQDGVYRLLAPIGTFQFAPDNIGEYFNDLLRIAIGLCAVLAVIMIVVGGIQYMGDESIFGKTQAKDRIMKAILGLLIALGSYALLNTINPDLLGGNINIKQVSVEIGGDTDVPIVFNKNVLPSGIVCSGDKSNIPTIVKSFKNKMTYEMGAKGVAGPNNTIKLDCSGFVNYVLSCANANFVNGGTASIFSGAEVVTSNSIQGTKINNIELKIGDLVGWRSGENSEEYGHVMIYIGEGQVHVADSHSTKTIGGALGIFPISKYQDRIKYIRRIP